MEITESNEMNKETKEDAEPKDLFFFSLKRKSLQTQQRKCRESQRTRVGFYILRR